MSRRNPFSLLPAVAVFAFVAAPIAAAEGDGNLWQTDFVAAKAQAKAEKKLLFVNFTGSDWCIFCKMLKSEVLDKDVFKTDAPKKFVLVELDYPRSKELSKDLKEQNEKLQKQYKIRGFPTVLLMDADGRAVARTGYRRGTPEDYVKNLNELVTIREGIVAMMVKLEKLAGLERAKLLDEVVMGSEKLGVEDESTAKYGEEIISLDPDNEAGLKVKYTFRNLLAEANKLKDEGHVADAQAAFEKAAAVSGITGEQKQDVYFIQGECSFMLQDFVGVAKCLKKAWEAAPDSRKASQIKQMLDHYTPMAEAQASLAKLKVELAKAKGLDRAKVLDQMVEAQVKLSARGGSPEIENWAKEIISLDADNKAGLKTKYECRLLLAEAGKHLKAKDSEKAQAALDKARALPGLSEAQKTSIESLAKGLEQKSKEEKQKPAPKAD